MPDSLAESILRSWSFAPGLIFALLFTSLVYVRGWAQQHKLTPRECGQERLFLFLAGLATVFVAIASPLDAFGSLLLSAHMTQHLLLMMVAPPLILLGYPTLPLMRGLPRPFLKEALGPFLAWPALQRVGRLVTWPPVSWLAFAVSTIGWHVPRAYEAALVSPIWHGAEHACFFWSAILFWWPVIQPWPSRPQWPRWTMIPYLLLGDILNTALAAAFVFSDRLLYPWYAGTQLWHLSAQGDQAMAGAIMWVPGSVIYLLPAIVLTVQIAGGSNRRRTHVRRPARNLIQIQEKAPRGFVPRPDVRRGAQTLMLALAVCVVADGLWGPQVGALNLAGVLPWIHWRGFVVIGLMAVGNVFCFACPFMLPRDLGRRVIRGDRRWPRALRSKWLAAGLLVIYLWAYEAFSLWDSPWITAWIVVGYFTTAFVVDSLFRGASFCKYICPIGQFNFIHSLVSSFEVKVRDLEVCKTCTTYDCIRGNSKQRGCELLLFQPKKEGNLDCTFCMDCVHACPHHNVSVMAVRPGSTLLKDTYRSSLGRLSKRPDVAMLAGVLIFGAYANAAGMVAPVTMWEHGWHARLGPHSMPLIIAILALGAIVMLPLAATYMCTVAGRWLGGIESARKELARRFVLALIPAGLSMWAAHLIYHLATGWQAAIPVIQRMAGLMPNWSSHPMMQAPGWLIPMQLLLLDAGLLLALYIAWSIASQYTQHVAKALGLFAPWMLLACSLYAAGVWICFQPMQMRGMMMN